MRVLAGERECPPDILLPVLAQVVAGDRDAARSGSRKRRRRFVDRRLARAARADERYALARVEPKVETLEDAGSSPPRSGR